jgi:hypothetical protein
LVIQGDGFQGCRAQGNGDRDQSGYFLSRRRITPAGGIKRFNGAVCLPVMQVPRCGADAAPQTAQECSQNARDQPNTEEM